VVQTEFVRLMACSARAAWRLALLALLHRAAVCPHALAVACRVGGGGGGAAGRVLRLRGGAVPGGGEDGAARDAPCEGPARGFREFAAPEDATSTEGFVRAAEERDAGMDHAEFLRYAETIKDGGDGPWAKELEEHLHKLGEDEQRRMSSGSQVCCERRCRPPLSPGAAARCRLASCPPRPLCAPASPSLSPVTPSLPLPAGPCRDASAIPRGRARVVEASRGGQGRPSRGRRWQQQPFNNPRGRGGGASRVGGSGG